MKRLVIAPALRGAPAAGLLLLCIGCSGMPSVEIMRDKIAALQATPTVELFPTAIPQYTATPRRIAPTFTPAPRVAAPTARALPTATRSPAPSAQVTIVTATPAAKPAAQANPKTCLSGNDGGNRGLREPESWNGAADGSCVDISEIAPLPTNGHPIHLKRARGTRVSLQALGGAFVIWTNYGPKSVINPAGGSAPVRVLVNGSSFTVQDREGKSHALIATGDILRLPDDTAVLRMLGNNTFDLFNNIYVQQ